MNTASSDEKRLPGAVTVSPASFSQQRLWFLQQWSQEERYTTSAYILQIDGPLRQEMLEQRLNVIIQRHEMLRTTFAFAEGQLTQMVAPKMPIPLPVCDVQDLPEEERESRARAEARRLASQAFDLARGPLMRCALVRCAPERYYLLLVVHQLLFDVRSIGLFLQELLQELAARSHAHTSERGASLAPLPMQYRDFALQEQAWLEQGAHAPHLAYWQHLLQQAPAALELPTSHVTRAATTDRGRTFQFALPERLVKKLALFCQEEGVSRAAALLAVFEALLSRYSGQEDFCLGTTSVEHTWPGTETLIGNFANPLLLRADLSGTPTFQELAGRVHTMLTTAYAHGDVPFEYLLMELYPDRRGQNTPFQIFFAFESLAFSLPAGWRLLPFRLETERSQFDLSLLLSEYPGELHGWVEYRADLFSAAAIERLAGHWLTLLEAALSQPAQPLALLPIITEQERHQIIEEWNATQAPYPQETPLQLLIEAQVARTPAAPAVSFASQRLKYSELNAQANQLAHALREKGVGPDTLVGICVERSLDMVVGLLGILKAGGAYLPLDPTYPAERLSFMLEDAQAAVLVTQSRLAARLPSHAASVLCLDTDAERLQDYPATNPAPVNTSSDLAYVIYTSGSTGRPKGVQICHRSLVNFLLSMQRQPGLSAEDRLLAVTTLSFDIAGLEIYLPLISGAQVFIASAAMAADGLALAQAITRERITVMQATPITWRLLLATNWKGNPQLRVFCGGEALPLDLARQLLARVAALWNLYGPTETTIWSSANEIKPDDERISIGRPIANTQVYLLDTHRQLVPVGVPGELFIGGDGLARGYLRRPELTDERFIPDPFHPGTTARLYRTGDLALYQADGTIIVLGRLDHQVKVRGFRIDLGEIEVVVSQHPAVEQVVVVVREEVPGDSRLVAYVVPHAGQRPTDAELQSLAQKHLPAYMLPYTFVFMEAFPQTPNGKIDRRALPAPSETGHQEAKRAYAVPQNFLQEQLVMLWEDLLQVRPLGIHDNFFDAGGHSFLALRLLERIESGYGKKLPLSTLLAGATVEQVAQALRQQDTGEAEHPQTRTPCVAVQTGGKKPPFFFLHGQWEGGAFYSLELARALGSDQPFYLLEPYHFVETEMPPTIEEMAAAHLEAMRRIQPEGPYQFGGWCNGALIAYEMARQLSAQGQRVDLLVLMDADAPAFRFRRERLFIDHLVSRLHLNPRKRVDWFLRYRHARLSLYAYRRALRGSRSHRPQEDYDEEPRPASFWRWFFPGTRALHQDWLGIYEWGVAGYLPSPYRGNMAFFWTEEEPFRKDKWRPWLRNTEPDIRIVPGNHITSRTRYLPALTEQLRGCVQQAEEAQSHRPVL